MRPNNRDAILRAAEALILERGVGALTLDETAARAGMSKGGLLYHFATKNELIESLLDFAFTNFELAVERLAKQDGAPGAWLRSYVKASFQNDKITKTESLAAAALIVAYFGKDSVVRKLYEAAHIRWSKRANEDGLSQARCDAIRMATDGLWLAEALGASSFTRARRQAFVRELIELTT